VLCREHPTTRCGTCDSSTALRALAKLQQLLPSRLRHRIDAVRNATLSLPGRGPTVDAEILTVIATAIRDSERFRFDYLDHDGTASRRSAEPHRLVFTGRRWYLLAWDDDRDDWRTFRADRIRPHTPNGPRFTPRQPPGGDAAAHVVRGVGSRAWKHPARVRLHAPVETVAEQLTPAAGLLRPADEHTSILETGGDSLHDLVAFLGSLEVAFTVIHPPELRDLLRSLADRYQAAAREPGR
jgi:predicted DNA-binding transcriptional regulator YafY